MLKRILPLTLLLFAMALVVHGQETAPKPAPAPAPPKTQLKVGQLAPEFTLPDTTGKPVSLADFRGKKNVILAFYVLAFTGG